LQELRDPCSGGLRAAPGTLTSAPREEQRRQHIKHLHAFSPRLRFAPAALHKELCGELGERHWEVRRTRRARISEENVRITSKYAQAVVKRRSSHRCRCRVPVVAV